MALSREERARLRAAGWAHAAATLPDPSPEQCRHIAALLAESASRFIRAKRAAARTGYRQLHEE